MSVDPKAQYQTVDEFIVTLKKLSDAGKGEYLVGCNNEYWLARKEDVGTVYDKYRSVDFGGYT